MNNNKKITRPDLDSEKIEKSIMIMKGIETLKDINFILNIEDVQIDKWLEIAKEGKEPYKSYAQELERFRHKNNYDSKEAIKTDFENYSDNEIEFLIEDNYLFSLDKTRNDKIELLKTRISEESLEYSITKLQEESKKLDLIKNLLFEFDEVTLISLGKLNYNDFYYKEKEEIINILMYDINLKNADKLIENLENYLNTLNNYFSTDNEENNDIDHNKITETYDNNTKNIKEKDDIEFDYLSGIKNINDEIANFYNPPEIRIGGDSINGQSEDLGLIIEFRDGVPLLKTVINEKRYYTEDGDIVDNNTTRDENFLKSFDSLEDDIDSISEDNDSLNTKTNSQSEKPSDFNSLADEMMNTFLKALKEGKSEEEAIDISGLNSVTLMTWKMLGKSGDEDYKDFYEEYINLK